MLVVFGDRLIVVQTKSKRLTQGARKGNDQLLRGDFGKAIQEAYDQAQSCAELLLQGCPAVDAAGQPLTLKLQPKEIFVSPWRTQLQLTGCRRIAMRASTRSGPSAGSGCPSTRTSNCSSR